MCTPRRLVSKLSECLNIACKGCIRAGNHRMATLNQKELHHIFRIQDSKNLLGWLQWRQNNSMAEWHILSKNVNAMWKKAELWYCPRCIGTCWLGRDKVWGKDIWVRDSFKCCELHLELSRHNKKKQHKQDSLYINYLRDKTHSIGRTKWQEGQSTRLFAGLKPKWVLMKYFLTSSSKYRSLIFFFFNTTDLLPIPYKIYIWTTEIYHKYQNISLLMDSVQMLGKNTYLLLLSWTNCNSISPKME